MTKHEKTRYASKWALAEWIALSSVLFIILALSAYFVWSSYTRSSRSEVSRMQAQVRMIDENLVHQFGAVRSALESIGTAVSSQHSLADNTLLLKTLRSALPGVRAIAILDANGHILVSDDEINDKKLDDSDFLVSIPHMRDPNLLYVAEPFENSPGVSNIKVAMAIPDSGGKARLSVAILDPEYFDVVMRSALYAPDMHSAITEAGGKRLLFVPRDKNPEAEEQNFPQSFFNRHIRSGQNETVLEGPSSIDGEDLLIVQKTINPSELHFDKLMVVSISREAKQMRQSWLQIALIYAAIWLVLAVTSVLMLTALQNRRRSFTQLADQHEEEREVQAQRMELALEGANLGLWDWQVKSGVLTTDPSASLMLGIAPKNQTMPYGEWRNHVHPDDIQHIDKAIARHIEKANSRYRMEYRVRQPGERWIWIQSRGKVVEWDADGSPARMVGTWMDITERKTAESEIERLAFFDGLTDLPNRRLLRDRLGQALSKSERANQYGAVLFIDLDNFKDLNDTLGHHIGDLLLIQVANRLRRETRDTDTVSRLGGDEFVVLFEGLGSTLAEATYYAESVSEKILKSLQAVYPLDGQEIYSTPSIGVLVFGGEPTSIDDVLKRADLAMYEAKIQGRNTFCMFSRDMHDEVVREALIESELRHAIQKAQLELYYQPIVAADTSLSGAEALVRWNHPERGVIPPAEFIPCAERTGLIISIGQLVIDQACAQLSIWGQQAATAHLTLSVNVSARQFRQRDFVSQVLGSIYKHGISPSRLKLELTESMLLDDFDGIRAKMAELRVYGVGFSLDDFGTGYSSLSYLKNLPFDQLKIDRSFVNDLPNSDSNAAIAKAIISLAHILRLRVVAEGIETESQRDFLIEHGCDYSQGYLFGRPMPITVFEEKFCAV